MDVSEEEILNTKRKIKLFMELVTLSKTTGILYFRL